MKSRDGLILNLFGLAFVLALAVSTFVAYSQMNREIASLACSPSGACASRLQPVYRTEGWIFFLSAPATLLILAGTRILYNVSRKGAS